MHQKSVSEILKEYSESDDSKLDMPFERNILNFMMVNYGSYARKKIKKHSIDFSEQSFKHERELFKGINYRIAEDHVYYENEAAYQKTEFTEEQNEILKLLTSLNQKIQRFEEYELKS